MSSGNLLFLKSKLKLGTRKRTQISTARIALNIFSSLIASKSCYMLFADFKYEFNDINKEYKARFTRRISAVSNAIETKENEMI